MPVNAPPVPAFAEDINQLIKEYETFVHAITLDETNKGHILIETKERATLTVVILPSGWRVIRVQPDDAPLHVKLLEGETYEQPEGFLMAASDEFKRLWHASLIEKLGTLDRFAFDE
ncbi:hypothetical protein Dda_4812 [Drechslerella dactyloides]|uniref:GSKIP domain-containing protein n=1 Tax=Drechslerella dactyloides TaxID=74499 RepID=A0AAD6IY13_DREDA|nr:hypothetical protein Dda_4812 [Drechslerella dactyloides]